MDSGRHRYINDGQTKLNLLLLLPISHHLCLDRVWQRESLQGERPTGKSYILSHNTQKKGEKKKEDDDFHTPVCPPLLSWISNSIFWQEAYRVLISGTSGWKEREPPDQIYNLWRCALDHFSLAKLDWHPPKEDEYIHLINVYMNSNSHEIIRFLGGGFNLIQPWLWIRH
jgi:hypothetical protein